MIAPCPYCGSKCELLDYSDSVVCMNLDGCTYESPAASSPEEAIEIHNKIASLLGSEIIALNK